MSLYFELSFGNPAAWDAASDYEVAAFVGDECRGVSEILPNANDCLYMRIRSNEANGETVTFKLRKKGSRMMLSLKACRWLLKLIRLSVFPLIPTNWL